MGFPLTETSLPHRPPFFPPVFCYFCHVCQSLFLFIPLITFSLLEFLSSVDLTLWNFLAQLNFMRSGTCLYVVPLIVDAQ